MPGAYLFLGAAAGDDHAGLPDNHSPRAAFDDSVLVDGATLLAELALRRCARSEQSERAELAERQQV